MENVEDVYVLSPMQEMMLLHELSGTGSDVLFNQFRYRVHGNLEASSLWRAWRSIVERHQALRTAFLWEGLKQPLQVVHRSVEISLVEFDWTDVSEIEQRSKFDAFCLKDRQQGFSLSDAPLLRLALMKLSERSYYFVWSSHHLVIDRWCIQPLFEELLEFYEPIGTKRTRQSESAPTYRQYIAWIQNQDQEDARRFWRSTLKGCGTPPRIAVALDARERAERGGDPKDLRRDLSRELTAALRSFATRNKLTLSVVVQAAWALVLSRLLSRTDVIFGATVSGRPPDLTGVERTVGSFINNLPVRIQISGATRLADWLQQIQLHQNRRASYEHVALADLYTYADLSPGESLFDSLLVWLAPVDKSGLRDLVFEAFSGGVATAYPLTLAITDGDRLGIQGICHPNFRTRAPLEYVLESFESALQEIASSASDSVLSSLNCVDSQTAALSPSSIPMEEGLDTGGEERRPMTAGASDEEIDTGGRESAGEDVLAEMLAAAWEKVLGRDDFSLDSGFFDIGGDSLSAIRLHAEVETATRQQIPLLALYQSPTVRGMAKLVQDQRWPLKPGVLAALRSRGERTPLFCIASPEVNAVGYAILAQHLGEQQPVYVLQSPPESTQVRRISIENMPQLAGQYLNAMKSVQADGPYNLLGMCSGGHLALEMGRQLHEAGERVAFLGILDTWAFFTISRWFFLRRIANRISYYSQRVRSLKFHDRRARRKLLLGFADCLRSVSAPFARSPVAAQSDVSSSQSAASGNEVVGHDESDWLGEYGLASKAKELPKFRGVVTLFSLGRKVYWRTREPDMGWSRHADEVKVERLAASGHREILRKPHVEAFARKVESLLQTGHAHQPESIEHTPLEEHWSEKANAG